MGKFAEPINEEKKEPSNMVDITPTDIDKALFNGGAEERPNIEAYDKATRINDFEILFNDSPEYFLVENARMIQEGKLIRFICFDNDLAFDHDEWYPISKIHRIKRYREYQKQDEINE